MDKLLRKRAAAKGKSTRIANIIERIKTEDSYDNAAIQIYAEQIQEIWIEVSSIHDEIMCECDEKGIPEHESEFNQIAEKIDSIKINIAHMFINENKLNSEESKCETENKIKLPRLDLPSFSGNFSDWISFKEIYLATVHNNKSLSSVQKLQYLKLSLKDEAFAIIQNLQISDVNYEKAWKLICDRFDNKFEIIYSTLDKLFSQPSVAAESAPSLRNLLDTTNQCLDILEVMEQPVHEWDTILIYFLRKKLDSESLKEWHLSHKDRNLRSFADFKCFLEQRASALASLNMNKKVNNIENKNKRNAVTHVVSDGCIYCKGQHPIYKCDMFIKLSVEGKKDFIRKNKLCSNCLRSGHFNSQCTRSGCKECKLKHNTLLHFYKNQSSNFAKTEPEVTSHFSHLENGQILLPTAIVKVMDSGGNFQTCRVLIDNASQSSFISENCVQRLKLNRINSKLRISGVSGKETTTTNGCVSVNLVSSFNNSKFINPELHVLNKITCNLPQVSVETKNLSCFDLLKLADPKYYISGAIDILLGADYCADIFLGNCIKAPQGAIAAHETIFGWVIFGQATPCKSKINVIHSHHSVHEIDTSLQKFWQVEDVPNAPKWSKEENQCEKHFRETHSRDPSGRYIVSLPFKEDSKTLGASRDMAVNRLKQIEHRLARQPIMAKNYLKFMQEYEELGHMIAIPDHEQDFSIENTYYIPHHYVKKEALSDSKFRVVFDASAKTSNNVSLNDNLLVGPTIQDDLFNLILRFRERAYALKADISKMYRQVRVLPKDTNYQRIVWRSSPDEPIRDYRLTTVTYGTASAAYLATKCLQQLVHDEGHEFPIAAEAVSKDFYVDDFLSGANTIQEAIQLQAETDALLKRGGFELRKWSSNEPKLLQSLNRDLLEINPCEIQSDKNIKTLGVLWDPNNDHFSFKLSANPKKISHSSKRTILSLLSQIFDPLGWITPVTIVGKILIQNLWKENLGWDEHLPANIEVLWDKFKETLNDLQYLKIPRFVSISNAIRFELHGFSDSSEKAYAAVVYLKVTNSNGDVDINLIAAKSRVAPLKTLTLPRLELCAAHLLAKLMVAIISGSSLFFPTTYCWCDSTIVLSWLKSPPNKWKTFVANRVAQINELLPNTLWQFVASEENPADCASRGLNPCDIKDHKLWWSGPRFLRNSEYLSYQPTCTEDVLEVRKEEKRVTSLVANSKQQTEDFNILQTFSSLSKLKRVTAYCFRFIRNCKLPVHERHFGFLAVSELEHALLFWVKKAQEEAFITEINALTKSKPIPTKSKILPLSPFLHDGILKVGGRLRNANVPEHQKHPTLLPKQHFLTQLIIVDCHVNNLHAGVQLTQATLVQKFWILSARSAIRKVIYNCIVCKKDRAQRLTQQMGDLPAARINPSRPFTHCGVDYAGPFTVKISKTTKAKTSKAYLALFICFSTKAVHLELVSDLTTDAFIAALKRFISRRGKCATMHSDCGTNFVGANRKLKEFATFFKSTKTNESVSYYLSENNIQWHFNPPNAPHMGGIWESNIKCVKQYLRKIVSNVVLSFEELYTIFVQIEGLLNSRPISPLSNDPNDLSVLTPGHFLSGGPLTAILEADYTNTKLNRLSRWQLTQRLVQCFWKRWTKEYILNLQQKSKWTLAKENLAIGDLVLVADDNLPSSKWKMGRVICTHPGKDGKVRVVTLRTANGSISRPVTKLCKL